MAQKRAFLYRLPPQDAIREEYIPPPPPEMELTAQNLQNLFRKRSPLVFQECWHTWQHSFTSYGVIHEAIRCGVDMDFMETLLQHPAYQAQINFRARTWASTPLTIASYKDRLDMMYLLIQHGALPYDCKHDQDNCPFYHALQNRARETTILLLHHERIVKKEAFDPYRHLHGCYRPMVEKDTPDFLTECLRRLCGRRGRAYTVFLPLLALCKRHCHPNVFRYVLQPMIRALWDRYSWTSAWEEHDEQENR